MSRVEKGARKGLVSCALGWVSVAITDLGESSQPVEEGRARWLWGFLSAHPGLGTQRRADTDPAWWTFPFRGWKEGPWV